MPLVQEIDGAVTIVAAQCELTGTAEATETGGGVAKLGKSSAKRVTVAWLFKLGELLLVTGDAFYRSGLIFDGLREQCGLLVQRSPVKQADNYRRDHEHCGSEDGDEQRYPVHQ